MSEIETGTDVPAVASEVLEPQVNEAQPEASTEGEQVNETPVEKTFTQKELDEILQKRLAKAEAKAERKATQAYREALEAVTRQQPVQSQQKSDEPTRDQFASDAEWIDAKVEYKLQQRDNAYKQQQQASSHKQMANKTESIYAQAAKLDGFDRETFDELPLTPTIATTIVDSDMAPQLMAYMANNPEEVERIASLSPARQAAELGKLEMKLQTTKTTKAPAPISPIGSKGSAAQKLDAMSFAEYKEARLKQRPSWAR